MFDSLSLLKNGNKFQREVFNAIIELNILNDLKKYTPIVCGTIPIGIQVDNSDIDIILEVKDFIQYEKRITELYKSLPSFKIKHTLIRSLHVWKVNFYFNGFEFELFAQQQPVFEQNAFLHMVIEAEILKDLPAIKEEIIRLE